MFYNVNLFIELFNFYSFGSKFLKDYLNNAISFCMGFGGFVECKSYLIFNILLMLNEMQVSVDGEYC